MGSIFSLYDSGLSHDKTKELDKIRKILCTVEY